jgi:hypothetical protein
VTIRFRILDWIVLLLSVLVTIFFTWFFYVQGSGPARLEITSPGGQFVYPLDATQTLHFHGPVGDTEVQIAGGQAWVDASDCSNKLCIAMGRIGKPGDWVACLPNRIFLKITGSAEGGVDAKTF